MHFNFYDTEEERLTELSSCKMSVNWHQYLQIESLPEEIKICGDKEVIEPLRKKIQDTLDHKRKISAVDGVNKSMLLRIAMIPLPLNKEI